MHDEELTRALLGTSGSGLGTAHDYRRKVEAMIQARERSVRLGAWASGAGYVTATLVAVALMIAAGVWFEGQMKAVWLGVNACFWLVFASILAFSRVMAKNHLETLKQLKGLEMRVLELQERLGKS